jgi:hypothetical protein
MLQKLFLGSLALIDLLIAVLKRIIGEGSKEGMVYRIKRTASRRYRN